MNSLKPIHGLEIMGKASLIPIIVFIVILVIRVLLSLVYASTVYDLAATPLRIIQDLELGNMTDPSQIPETLRPFVDETSWTFTIGVLLSAMYAPLALLGYIIPQFIGIRKVHFVTEIIYLNVYKIILYIAILACIVSIIEIVITSINIYRSLAVLIINRLPYVGPWYRYYFLWLRPAWIYDALRQHFQWMGIVIFATILSFILVCIFEAMLFLHINRTYKISIFAKTPITLLLCIVTFIIYGVSYLTNIYPISILEISVLIVFGIHAYFLNEEIGDFSAIYLSREYAKIFLAR